MATNDNTSLPATANTSTDGSAAAVTVSEQRSSSMLQQAHHYVTLKLSSSNFLFWKAQLVPFLRSQSLYGYVDGTHQCPPVFLAASSTATPVLNLSHAIWIQQDQSILSMLISSMTEEVLYLAIGHSTSRAVWVAVETASGSVSRSLSLSLLSQLQGLQQGDSSPAVYLGKAQVLVEQLAQAGRPISLDEQNLHVFRGLRPEYRGLVASLTTKSSPLTILEVADLLATHQYPFPDETLPPPPATPTIMVAQ
ncbi:PREDICTED: uncharacterized protein LOC109175113 [Ipomoea nil]|uniref:uncharacterized protein LOC109175113 n=1 Tax=Ipomoea nil TaxID=35883 RepID=UPI0009019011|nr:PREDICTED: uncharacterized protein LOC109175113 [Ipomoea nil]